MVVAFGDWTDRVYWHVCNIAYNNFTERQVPLYGNIDPGVGPSAVRNAFQGYIYHHSGRVKGCQNKSSRSLPEVEFGRPGGLLILAFYP